MFQFTTNHLLFPRLVRQGPVGEGKLAGRSLFALDWTDQDRQLRERHAKWNASCWPGVEIPIVPALTPDYEAWMAGLRFALDGSYLEEIRSTTRAALEEWGRIRRFDTMVRYVCLRPSQAFVGVAFFLLGDCIYDEAEQYFSRDPRRSLFCPAALYRFWCHQTGRGLIRDLADFDRLQGEPWAQDFLAMIGDQEQRREAIYDQVCAFHEQATKQAL